MFIIRQLMQKQGSLPIKPALVLQKSDGDYVGYSVLVGMTQVVRGVGRCRRLEAYYKLCRTLGLGSLYDIVALHVEGICGAEPKGL